jgi:hypothetical protein
MKLRVRDPDAGVAFDVNCTVTGMGGNEEGVTIECRDGSRLVVVTLTHAEFCTLYVQYRDNWIRGQEIAAARVN